MSFNPLRACEAANVVGSNLNYVTVGGGKDLRKYYEMLRNKQRQEGD